ncbi:GNAT family N-acetyltransferase [Parasutterella excrementihominis]|jgi:ribosomal protein S18 acetylase RimI-like enzyme|uniref:GNAT family N-acetyltransferase n=1 Tax=Parasutterella excrementihominis TaxID=487175 RepID=UPI00242BE7AF|nr:GNAT family N-acetyltransferase [Parasutterella excrementihominis]
MIPFTKPLPLREEHQELFQHFQCGELTLDNWLKTKALENEIKGASRTFLSFSTETGDVAGYFSLASHSVRHLDLRAKLRRNMPEPLPVILLGRLAVDNKYQRHGLGESLLYEAVRIVKAAAETIGIVALVVHPISEDAAAFYIKHGFSVAKTSKQMLFMGLR